MRGEGCPGLDQVENLKPREEFQLNLSTIGSHQQVLSKIEWHNPFIFEEFTLDIM